MKNAIELNLGALPDRLKRDFEVTADVTHDGDCNILSISVVDISNPNKNHYGLRFNVDWANQERIEWLADVLSRDMAENIWEAKKNQRQYIQSASYKFGKAIGLDIHKLG